MGKSDKYIGVSLFTAKKSVGSGWSRLIDKAYDRMPPMTFITTVKEKFGGLRIYVTSAPTSFLNFLDKLEDESFRTCEACGFPGRVEENAGGWWKTLCDSCRNLNHEDLIKKISPQ